MGVCIREGPQAVKLFLSCILVGLIFKVHTSCIPQTQFHSLIIYLQHLDIVFKHCLVIESLAMHLPVGSL